MSTMRRRSFLGAVGAAAGLLVPGFVRGMVGHAAQTDELQRLWPHQLKAFQDSLQHDCEAEFRAAEQSLYRAAFHLKTDRTRTIGPRKMDGNALACRAEPGCSLSMFRERLLLCAHELGIRQSLEMQKLSQEQPNRVGYASVWEIRITWSWVTHAVGNRRTNGLTAFMDSYGCAITQTDLDEFLKQQPAVSCYSVVYPIYHGLQGYRR